MRKPLNTKKTLTPMAPKPPRRIANALIAGGTSLTPENMWLKTTNDIAMALSPFSDGITPCRFALTADGPI
jgi:hypothetical protein